MNILKLLAWSLLFSIGLGHAQKKEHHKRLPDNTTCPECKVSPKGLSSDYLTCGEWLGLREQNESMKSLTIQGYKSKNGQVVKDSTWVKPTPEVYIQAEIVANELSNFELVLAEKVKLANQIDSRNPIGMVDLEKACERKVNKDSSVVEVLMASHLGQNNIYEKLKTCESTKELLEQRLIGAMVEHGEKIELLNIEMENGKIKNESKVIDNE